MTAIALLTGHYPRDLIDQETLEWRWQTYVRVGQGLEAILTKLVQQKPKARFQTAHDVMQQLAQLTEAAADPISPLVAEPAWAAAAAPAPPPQSCPTLPLSKPAAKP